MNPHQVINQYFQINRKGIRPYVGTMGSRDSLADVFAALGYNTGAEIGVWKGQYSEILCKANPKLKLYCVDPWAPFRQSGETGSARLAEKRFESTQARLKPYPNVIFKRMSSYEASLEIPDGSLDFVYIDALHDFDNAIRDILYWEPKVRVGGIVSGHDYFYHPEVGVVQAVNAYTAAHGIDKLYVTYERMECQSFFWVKE